MYIKHFNPSSRRRGLSRSWVWTELERMLGLIGADSGMSGECKVAHCIKPDIKRRRWGGMFLFLVFSVFFCLWCNSFNNHHNTGLHNDDQNYHQSYCNYVVITCNMMNVKEKQIAGPLKVSHKIQFIEKNRWEEGWGAKSLQTLLRRADLLLMMQWWYKQSFSPLKLTAWSSRK